MVFSFYLNSFFIFIFFSLNEIYITYIFRDCTRFKQFDWLKEKFYTSINSESNNRGTIFLLPALKIHSYFDKNEILMTKLELCGMN